MTSHVLTFAYKPSKAGWSYVNSRKGLMLTPGGLCWIRSKHKMMTGLMLTVENHFMHDLGSSWRFSVCMGVQRLTDKIAVNRCEFSSPKDVTNTGCLVTCRV